jgi:hypothetical protein
MWFALVALNWGGVMFWRDCCEILGSFGYCFTPDLSGGLMETVLALTALLWRVFVLLISALLPALSP